MKVILEDGRWELEFYPEQVVFVDVKSERTYSYPHTLTAVGIAKAFVEMGCPIDVDTLVMLIVVGRTYLLRAYS